MDHFFEEVLKKLTINNKTSTIISFTILLIGLINNLTSAIDKFPLTRLSVSLSAIVFFFTIRRVLNELKGTSTKQKIFVKGGKISIYFLWFVPIYFLGIYGYNKKVERQECQDDLKKVAVLITNFNNDTDINKDGFSNILYGKLNEDLQNTDTINVKLLPQHVLETSGNFQHSAEYIFQQNCSTKGIVVFGNRINQKIDQTFDCRIYSFNFLDFQAKEFFKNSKKTVIYIQNPNLINFTIEYQTNTVASFIHGLLYRSAGHYELSNSYFKRALELNNNKNNTELISLCHFFIGNNFIKLQKIDDAIKEYNDGIVVDSTNEYLHFNIAALYNNDGKVENAYNEYKIAHDLNPSLLNPLKEINTLTKYSKPIHLVRLRRKIKIVDTIAANKIDSAKKIAIIKEKWNEQCWTTLSPITQKYGVINNRKDTIVQCRYDGIDSFPYKNADCFIVKLGNKFGAFIHIHYDDGYTVHEIPVEYSDRTIREAVIYCIDNHKQ